MREIERTTQFRRYYKRETKGRHRATLDVIVSEVLHAQVIDAPLATRYRVQCPRVETSKRLGRVYQHSVAVQCQLSDIDIVVRVDFF